MRISLRRPKPETLQSVLERAAATEPSPPLDGALDRPSPPDGFRFGEIRAVVGYGPHDAQRARAALRDWRFLPAWAYVYPGAAAQTPGTNLLMVARTVGVWSTLPARVIETIDGADRTGFVYAALPGHVAWGIERFAVEHDPSTDEVVFAIKAVANPQLLMVRLARPLFGLVQSSFRRACARRVRAEVKG